MTEQGPLKRIDPAYFAQAVEKAAHYRLLNWPEEAESICLDVLAVEPRHQKALEVLCLALTDQFAGSGQGPRVQEAKNIAAQLDDEYERIYLLGIIHEREGRAHLARGFSGSFAYECFEDAMECYEKALALAPADNQEAALRFNSCQRTIERERLQPPSAQPELPLE